MGIIDVLSTIISSAARITAHQRADFSREYERKHPDMSSAERDKFEEFNRMTDKFAEVGKTSVVTTLRTNNNADKLYLNKSITEWDSEWKYIGYLNNADLTSLTHCVGLYRFERLGHVVFIGSATELSNGDLSSALRRYHKNSYSSSKADKLICEHFDSIEVYVLVIGDTADAIDATRRLKGSFISRYWPLWNN